MPNRSLSITRPPQGRGEERTPGPARHLALLTRWSGSFHNLDIDVRRVGEILRLGGEGTAGGLARPAVTRPLPSAQPPATAGPVLVATSEGRIASTFVAGTRRAQAAA
jgi:hypothetical protein